MSWLGLTHKGVEPLYPDEWNRVVDSLDILYGYVANLDARLTTVENKVDKMSTEIEQYYLEVKRELEDLSSKVEEIYLETVRPSGLETYRKAISVTPVPLSDVDKEVKKIHVKVPSWALYLVYLGDSSSQEFILEPGDVEDLTIRNPKLVYVRSLGNVEIFVALEV